MYQCRNTYFQIQICVKKLRAILHICIYFKLLLIHEYFANMYMVKVFFLLKLMYDR